MGLFLSNIPAEGHSEGLIAEQLDLFTAVDGGIEVDAVQGLEQFQSLHVLFGVSGVGSVFRVGEGTAVEVVDQSTGTLVAALSGAVNSTDIFLTVSIQRLDCVDEAVGCPGVVFFIDVLESVSGLEQVVVDGHVVGSHADREFIVGAFRVVAGGFDRGINFFRVIGRPQISEVDHQSFCTPVGNQTFRTFEDEVRSLTAFDSGVDLVVAIGVVQQFDGNMDVRIDFIELVDQSLDGFCVAPVADGVGPEGDVLSRGSIDQCEGEDQTECKKQR